MVSPYLLKAQERIKAREIASLHMNDQAVYIPSPVVPTWQSLLFNAMPYIVGALLLITIALDMWNGK